MNTGRKIQMTWTLVRVWVGCWVALSLIGCTIISDEEVETPNEVLVAESLGEFTRASEPEGLSGISRIGGNRYYCVNDRDGLLHEMEIVFGEDGKVVRCQELRRVWLEGRVDLEGCAVDPLDGRVWVSDEHDHSVRQFDPVTGRETGRIDIPEVFTKNMVPNRSFEALALSPDGLRLYVANEDTLRCDGAVANRQQGGRVRIQEFARTGKGAPWTPTHQLFYDTEKIEGEPYAGLEISGVVSLCVTEAGTLLVLERELSQKNPLVPSFLARLYAVSPDARSEPVRKRLVWEEDTVFANYEGICFGPDLRDGRRSLILISDGGGKAVKTLLTLGVDENNQ